MSAIATPTSAPELLAPAGDWDAMRAAVANGADAVYFGLDQFNARYRATNFKLDELPQIMAYLHAHNVKGFVTFNTLIFSDELPAAADYIKKIAEAGVDAVIVQDLGVARLIGLMAPSLHVHGSTQMTLTEPRGIEFVRKLGVNRVVLARELSLDDIKKIVGVTDMPLEVFVHGALCVAYSGQCLTSEALGGRSANRGQCAQACRLPYELVVDGQMKDLGEKNYLLSPQDLAAYDLIGDLTALGVASFKVEGRLKSAHYVAATSQTYRQAIDDAMDRKPFRISDQQRGDLEQTFSRGFTHGFLSGVDHQTLVAARFPKSRGRRVGTVARITMDGIVVQLEDGVAKTNLPTQQGKNHRHRAPLPAPPPAALKPGDGVVFDEGHPEQDEQGGRIFAVRSIGRSQVEIELGHGDVNPAAIAIGSIVWKTDDPHLRKRLEHSFSREGLVVRRTPIDATVTARVGEKLSLTMTDGLRSFSASWDKPLEVAAKFPVNESTVREQLARLGDTPFELRKLTLDAVGGPMVPKSVLNDLRRQMCEELLAAREQAGVHAVVRPDTLAELRSLSSSVGQAFLPVQHQQNTPVLHVLARTLEQVDALLAIDGGARPASIYCDFEDVRRYKDAVARCNAAGVPVAVATMRVVKPGEDGWLQQILDCNPDALIVRNLAAIAFYQELAPHLPLIGDYSLNITNELTANLFAESGLVRYVASYDLNWRQMAAMFARTDVSRFECVVHQHMPMFHMEHCVFAHTLSTGKDYRDCGRPCERHQVDLRDRVGEPHPLIPDAGCRNTVFNAKAQSAAEFIPAMAKLGIRHFRVELLRERPEQVAAMVAKYADVIAGRSEPVAAVRSLRVLNQLGVTRGTLDRE